MGALLQSMTNVKQRADGWSSQAAADSRSKQTRASDAGGNIYIPGLILCLGDTTW